MINRAIKQQQEIWESVRIEIGADYVARQQIRVPEIRIHREKVTSIQEIDNGLLLSTADKFRSLVIPIELDPPDYEEIKTALSAWAPIQPKSPTTKVKNSVLLILLLIGVGIIFFSWSAWLVLVVGLVMIGYYAYIFWLLQRHKGVDPRFRRNVISAFGFLLFITSFKLCALFGWYELLFQSLANGAK